MEDRKEAPVTAGRFSGCCDYPECASCVVGLTGAPGMALCSRWRAGLAVGVTAVVLAGLGAAIWALGESRRRIV